MDSGDNTDNIIFFDGVCNLCSTFVQFVLRHEKDHDLLFSSLQSDFSRRFFESYNSQMETDVQPESNGEYQSIYFYSKGRLYDQSSAALEIASHLKRPYSYIRRLKFIPKPIRDFVYRIVSANRYKLMGKKSECWMPQPKYAGRFMN